MHPCMTFGARFGRLMACRVVVLLWCRGHVLLQGGDLPSPAALRRSVGAANPDAKKKKRRAGLILVFSRLDELSGGSEGGASTQARGDVPSFWRDLHRPGDCRAAGNDVVHPTPARRAAP